MPTETKTPKTYKNKVFFGKLWVNTVNKEDGKHAKGEKFMSGYMDNKFKGIIAVFVDKEGKTHKIPIVNTDQIQLWKNTKRDGSRDADFRLSILTNAEVPANINGTPKNNTIDDLLDEEVETKEDIANSLMD